MAGFLLDSTLHIQWGRGVAAAHAWLASNSDEDLFTSVVSVAETYSGVRPDDHARWDSYLSQFTHIPVDTSAAKTAGGIRFRLARQGRRIEIADALIAAQALLNDWAVVTANVKDFAPTGVQVVEVR